MALVEPDLNIGDAHRGRRLSRRAVLSGAAALAAAIGTMRTDAIATDVVTAGRHPMKVDDFQHGAAQRHHGRAGRPLPIYYLGLSPRRTDLDFDRLSMRRAISWAIDRQAIVRALLRGHVAAESGPLPAADPSAVSRSDRASQFDLGQAKSLVRELGWSPGVDGMLARDGVRLAFNLVVAASSFSDELGQMVQTQLLALGMAVTVEALDRESYLAALTEGSDAVLWPGHRSAPFVSAHPWLAIPLVADDNIGAGR